MLQLPPVKIDWEGRQYTLVLPCPPIDLVRAASFQGSVGGEQKLQSLLRENPSLLIYASIKFGQAFDAAPSSLEELSGWLISNLKQLHAEDGSETTNKPLHLPEIKKLAWKFIRAYKPKKKEKVLRKFLEAACSIDHRIAKQILKSSISDLLDKWSFSDGDGAIESSVSAELINRKWGQSTENPVVNDKVRFSESEIKRGLNGASSLSLPSLPEPSSNGRIGHEMNRRPGARKKNPGNQRGVKNSNAINERNFQKRLLEEKLASLQQLAYGASHEINNPLANIATRAQSLLAGEKDPERLHKLGVIYEQAMRAHEMISDLMLFANPPALKYEQIPLREFLRTLNLQVKRSLFPYAPGLCQRNGQGSEGKIRFATRIAPNVTTLEVDTTQLAVAILALIRNSMEASRSGNEFIELRVSAPDDEYCFSISDDGIGVAPEIRRHMFDPFYSGREAGRGLGFGLCKAWRIAKLHSGDLIFVEEHSPGARFDLKIPVRRP